MTARDISAEPQAIRALLGSARTIAIVGISPKTERASNEIGRYLLAAGYTIVPVNPGQSEILGEKCYPDLGAIPFAVDIVNIFRRPEDCPPVIEAAIAAAARSVWLQLGITAPTACAQALAAGLQVVANRCIKTEHIALFGDAER